jgi:hypothetical protein
MPKQRGAHRARLIALRPEHIAVHDQRILAAEQAWEIHWSVFSDEPIGPGHLAAIGQRATLLGHALDMAAQLDFLSQQRDARAAIFLALVRIAKRAGLRQFRGRLQYPVAHGMTSICWCRDVLVQDVPAPAGPT